MKRKLPFPLAISLVAVLSASLYFSFSSKNSSKESFNNTLETKIIEVIDGDTVITQEGWKVRYIGINAPEKGEPGYLSAKSLNENLVKGKKVVLEFDLQKKDKYQRYLAYIWLGDILVNEELVKLGRATTYTLPPNLKYQKRLLLAQQYAKQNCLGFWESFCQKSDNKKCVKISKINFQAPGDDNKNLNGEWIEIQNICSFNIDLSNWQIKDSSSYNKYYFKNFILKANSKVKIYSGCGKDTSFELYWQCPPRKYAIWNNSGDTAYLLDKEGKVVDIFSY